MATRSIKPKFDEPTLGDYESIPESAPSTVRKEGTLLAQIFLFVGFFLTIVGVLALVAPRVHWSYFIGPGIGYAVLTIGLVFILYHCFVDRETTFRRLYMLLAFLLLAAALLTLIFPSRGLDDKTIYGAYFLPLGVPFLFLALAFFVGVLIGETDPFWRRTIRLELLGVGVLGLAYGVLRGFFSVDFLTGHGLLSITLGLAYLLSYLGSATGAEESELGDRVKIALGLAAALTFVAAVIVSWLTPMFFVPRGVILSGVGGLIAIGVYAAMTDRPTFVLARRELMSYFYSPVAYLVLFGLVFIFAFTFFNFISGISESQEGEWEPIVAFYFVSWFPVIALIVMVPIITMRLLSEEKRSGSIEVLLTAPVNESSIVLGKFLAAWVFFLIAWSPYFLFLIALRIFGNAPFEYRPVLSYGLAIAASGAGFIAMGLFFSSLTSNQIIAAVLTFAGMLFMLGIYFLKRGATGATQEFLTHISFIEIWIETAQGSMPVRYFISHISIAVLFLYMTVLSLGSRKWN